MRASVATWSVTSGVNPRARATSALSSAEYLRRTRRLSKSRRTELARRGVHGLFGRRFLCGGGIWRLGRLPFRRPRDGSIFWRIPDSTCVGVGQHRPLLTVLFGQGMARAGALIADIQDVLGRVSNKMARPCADDAHRFAADGADDEVQPRRLDLPVQVDHRAAKSLMVLPPANLMVLPRVVG